MAYTAVIAAIYPGSERAQAMGKVRIGASIAGIAAAATAGIVIDVVPATYVFAAVALLSLPGAIGFFWIRDEGRTATAGRGSTFPAPREIWDDHRDPRALAAH